MKAALALLASMSRFSGRLQLLLALVFLFTSGTAVTSFAISESPGQEQARHQSPDSGINQRPKRPPPKAAIEACEGKTEGDLCNFIAPDGGLNGECHAGQENIFACRPHRQEKPGDSVPTKSSGPPPEQGAASKGAKAPGVAAGQKDNRTTPLASETGVAPVQPANLSKEQIAKPVQSASAPAPGSGQRVAEGELPGNLDILTITLCLAVTCIAILITWYSFYRNSTLPLRRLRMVTQKLARGELSARVGEGLVPRNNEVAELARDVDRMAARIEGLVGAHQRLIRDVSHELRSPLARLNVALELARQSAGPAHTAPFDRIERESERLNELIGQLLMLTKLESESGMKRITVDLAELVLEIIHDVDFEAKNNDREVIVGECEALLLHGDRELLRQALENLVRNAISYTAPGTAVEVSLHRKETGGRNWAHIEVRDHGPGVPEAELLDIFRPFYRVSDSRERQSGGTGVGLAISDRAVRLHGGRIRAINAAGDGLIMEVELPLE